MLGLSRQSQGAGLQALDSRLRGKDKGGVCSHRGQGQRCNAAAIPAPRADRTFHSHRSQGQRCNGGGSTVVLCLYKFHSHRSQGQRCNFAIHEWTEGAKYVSLPPEPGAALQLLLMLASASSIAVSLPPEPGAALQPQRLPCQPCSLAVSLPPEPGAALQPRTPLKSTRTCLSFTPTGARGSVATFTTYLGAGNEESFHSHRSQGQRCNGNVLNSMYGTPGFHSHRSQGQRCNFIAAMSRASLACFTPTGARGSVATDFRALRSKVA